MGLIDNKYKTLQEAFNNALPNVERVDTLTAFSIYLASRRLSINSNIHQVV